MECRTCGGPLVERARFCAVCGTPVATPCPSCGTALPADARFCPSCGTAVDGPRPASVAEPAGPARRERKVASIVFADIVGFTDLNERHDPELVQALVSRAFDRLSDEVRRYEGVVEKFAGDAMLALFGVPQAHEDDPERAVRAALEMQAAMAALGAELRVEGRPELSLRVGIETGEVLVDQSRVASERDRMVTGDPVNVAARLQQLAAPSEVIVGPGTYAGTRDVVEYEELPATALKGKSARVVCWRATRIKARRGGRRSPLGIEAPLVGRDAELALLKDHVRRTAADRRPHLVTVVGSPGVGKSRLTWELEKYLDGLPDVYVWRKGRCLAYAQAAYGAIADLVRGDLGAPDDQDAEAVHARITTRLDELGLPAAMSHALGALIGTSGAGRPRGELFEAWRRYAEALARVAPAVLVLEDIHWADEGTLDWIEHVARWAEGPIVLLCLARHELLERRPAWGGGIANAALIVLEPLGDRENASLVEGLLPGGIPEALASRIVALAEGNALFTEELVRMFVDRGVIRYVDGRWELARAADEIVVPESVHAVLAARLDTLPPDEKAVTQDAAVVGRIFWDAVLVYLGGGRPASIDEFLRRLRVKELVVPREPSSLSGASEFGFRHVLIRDVAYDSLPKRERAAKHRHVAEWAERELADAGDDVAELLASHYLSALRYEEEFSAGGPALEDLQTRAYRYARLAADRAFRLDERDTAARWWRVAVELARKLDRPGPERAAVALATLEGATGIMPMDELTAIAEETLVLIEAARPTTPDLDETEARIRGVAAYAYHNRGDNARAQQVLREALQRLEGGPPSSAHASLLSRLGWTLWRQGDVATAADVLTRAVDEARAVEDRSTEAWTLHELAIVYEQGVRRGEGVALMRESLALARELADVQLVMRAHINLPALLFGLGAPWQEIMPILEEGISLARRAADRSSEGWLAVQVATVYEELGRVLDEQRAMREAIEAARAVGEIQSVRTRLLALGWTEILRGRWDEAGRLAAEARELPHATEEQERVHLLIWDALAQWREDPLGAARALAAKLPAITVDVQFGALWLARMALRTRDGASMRLASGLVAPHPEPFEGPLWRLYRRNVAALGLPSAGAAAALDAIARDYDEAGYRYRALHAHADAALAWARAGDMTAAEDAARRADGVAAATGLVHELGALPETPWIASPEPAVADA